MKYIKPINENRLDDQINNLINTYTYLKKVIVSSLSKYKVEIIEINLSNDNYEIELDDLDIENLKEYLTVNNFKLEGEIEFYYVLKQINRENSLDEIDKLLPKFVNFQASINTWVSVYSLDDLNNKTRKVVKKINEERTNSLTSGYHKEMKDIFDKKKIVFNRLKELHIEKFKLEEEISEYINMENLIKDKYFEKTVNYIYKLCKASVEDGYGYLKLNLKFGENEENEVIGVTIDNDFIYSEDKSQKLPYITFDIVLDDYDDIDVSPYDMEMSVLTDILDALLKDKKINTNFNKGFFRKMNE